MRTQAKFLVPALAVCCAVASAMTLDDLSPGKTVDGPALTLKEMKGKVVYVVYWGTH
jgi:hypothetical protein